MHVLGGPSCPVPRPRAFRLPLVESRKESPTVMTFRFSTKGTDFQYLSNQAIRLALPGVDDPWGAVRTFSLSSSPSEPDQISVTCRISDTPFKQSLAQLATGATVEVYGPLGCFLFDGARPAVFIAGGIGITPFRGMLRFAADTKAETPRRLIYSARVPEELVFRSELDEIARGDPRLRVGYAVTRPSESSLAWAGRTRRIDTEWIREASEGLDRPKYYVAGLPEMVQSTLFFLGPNLGISEDDVDYEVFRGF